MWYKNMIRNTKLTQDIISNLPRLSEAFQRAVLDKLLAFPVFNKTYAGILCDEQDTIIDSSLSFAFIEALADSKHSSIKQELVQNISRWAEHVPDAAVILAKSGDITIQEELLAVMDHWIKYSPDALEILARSQHKTIQDSLVNSAEKWAAQAPSSIQVLIEQGYSGDLLDKRDHDVKTIINALEEGKAKNLLEELNHVQSVIGETLFEDEPMPVFTVMKNHLALCR